MSISINFDSRVENIIKCLKALFPNEDIRIQIIEKKEILENNLKPCFNMTPNKQNATYVIIEL